jgi:hypothetical protein
MSHSGRRSRLSWQVGVPTPVENQPSRRFPVFKTAISGVVLLFLTAAASAGERASDKYKATLDFDHTLCIPGLEDQVCP